MVSRKKIILYIALVLTFSMSFTALILTLGFKAELIQYKTEQSTEPPKDSDEDTQRRIDALEENINALKTQINSIPIDEKLLIENRVYEWIEVFYKNQANQIDKDALAEIMYIPTDDTEFYTPENLEKTAIMFTSILRKDEGLDIKMVNKANNHYRISTLDGNSFDIYIQDDMKIASPWYMAYKTDQYIQNFIKELKAKNKEILYQYITYEAYDWTADDFENAYDKHLGKVSTFNLDSIGYLLVGITQDGFRYEIYDRKTQEKEYFDVNTSDGILLIKNSNYHWGE